VLDNNRIFPMTAQNVYAVVRAVSKAAGLEGIAPHDLRRTMAKMARAGGAPIEQIQQVLGHSSVRTTQLYLGLELELKPGLAATDFIDVPYLQHRS